MPLRSTNSRLDDTQPHEFARGALFGFLGVSPLAMGRCENERHSECHPLSEPGLHFSELTIEQKNARKKGLVYEWKRFLGKKGEQ